MKFLVFSLLLVQLFIAIIAKRQQKRDTQPNLSSNPAEPENSEDYSYDYYGDLDLSGPKNDAEVKQESQSFSDNPNQNSETRLNLKIEKVDTDYEGMDMNEHAAHMGHGGHGGHNMAMSFNFNLNIEYLFAGWKIETNMALVWYCLVTILLGILVEWIKTIRITKLNNKKKDSYQHKYHNHIKQSFLHLIQSTVGYLLMLVAMTFNVYLFVSVMVGLSLGYFYFKAPIRGDLDCDCCDNICDSSGESEERKNIKKHVEEMDCCA